MKKRRWRFQVEISKDWRKPVIVEKNSLSKEKMVHGTPRLRNIDRWCSFYNHAEKRCQAYKDRPLGCYLYPVVYSVGEGVVIDELCPMYETISEPEFKAKGIILINLLKTMENETAKKLH